MSPYIVFYIIIGILAVGGLSYFIIGHRVNQKRIQTIASKISLLIPQASALIESEKPYLFRVETEQNVYLIKPIYMNPSNELIITNPDFWCVNSDPRNWNRSSSPELIPGVSAFRKSTVDSLKKLTRIGLVYPSCLHITRYLNESDVEVVTPFTDVAGVRIVCFDLLGDFFAKVEKK
jgi:hypothetical protein